MGGFRNKNKNKKRRAAEASSGGTELTQKKNNNTDDRGAMYSHDPKYLKNDRMVSFYSSLGVFGHGMPTPSTTSPLSTYNTAPTNADRVADRTKFLTSVIKPLNASFRVTANAPTTFYDRFNKEIAHFTAKPMDLQIDSPDGKTTTTKTIQAAKSIPFLPHAYQLDVDRKTIRKHPALNDFHKFLILHTEIGHITRQETVSMVPPAVLDVQAHHSVLDMCAAPGSKTTQVRFPPLCALTPRR